MWLKPTDYACYWLLSLWVTVVPYCNFSLLIILVLESSVGEWLSALLWFKLANHAYPWLCRKWVVVVPCYNSSLLMMLILISSLTMSIIHHGPFSLWVYALFSLCSVYTLLICLSLFSKMVNVFYMSIKQNSHFLKRKSILCHFIPFKMWDFSLSTSFFFSDLWYYLLKLISNKSSQLHVMLSMLCFHF